VYGAVVHIAVEITRSARDRTGNNNRNATYCAGQKFRALVYTFSYIGCIEQGTILSYTIRGLSSAPISGTGKQQDEKKEKDNNRNRTLQGETILRDGKHARPLDIPQCPRVGLVPYTPVSS
jgi:hypothetical protein